MSIDNFEKIKKAFKAQEACAYFEQTDREIDWDENNTSMVSKAQYELISKIIGLELSIFVLRRTSGLCDSVWEALVKIRRELINNYEKEYEPYVSYNEF